MRICGWTSYGRGSYSLRLSETCAFRFISGLWRPMAYHDRAGGYYVLAFPGLASAYEYKSIWED